MEVASRKKGQTFTYGPKHGATIVIQKKKQQSSYLTSGKKIVEYLQTVPDLPKISVSETYKTRNYVSRN